MINILKKIFWHPIFALYLKARNKYIWTFVIPPYTEKREIIKKYGKDNNLHIFLETGTFLGDTVDFLKNDFDRLCSIELSEDLASRAQKRFANEKKITILQGDSGLMLPKFLKEVNEPVLFWLDGHYSSNCYVDSDYIETALGDLHTPILKELKEIYDHNVTGHVILIDDARLFNGNDDYPTYKALKKYVKSLCPSAKISIQRDIIRIV